MRRLIGAGVVGSAVLVYAACGSYGSSPTAPSSPATPKALNLTGTWTGSLADSQGGALVSWTLTQSGSSITGSAVTSAQNPNDGSCASCHKAKNGTFSGTLADASLTASMKFAEGEPGDITPICGVVLNAAAAATDDSITATYTGSDTCEGPVTDGKLTMSRKK